jgi:hypothetical protein
MKKVILAVSAISILALTANAKVKCVNYAEKKAAEYLNMSLCEFRQDSSLLFTCKSKANPNMETIQFGDGRGFIGVELEVIKGKCIVKEIYTGQDDQDFSEEDFQESCLPELIVI